MTTEIRRSSLAPCQALRLFRVFIVCLLPFASAAAPAGGEPFLYAVDALGDRFITIDLAAGTADFLPMTESGSAFDAGSVLQSLEVAPDGTLYAGFRKDSPFLLTTLDPSTGAVTGLESDLFGGRAGAENLAFDIDGELLTTFGGAIYRIDLTASPISSTATGIDFENDVDAFEIMDDGRVFFVDASSPTPSQSTLFRRDRASVGPSVAVQIYDLEIFGMTAVDGTLYVADERTDRIFEVDQTTGDLTVVFDFASTGNDVRIGSLAHVVDPEVDIVLSITESEDPVALEPGPEPLTYTLSATNRGPSQATHLEIDVVTTLPGGVRLDSAMPTAGTFNGSTWALPGLGAGASPAELVLEMTVAPTTVDGALIEVVASLEAVDQPILMPDDDVAEDDTRVQAQVDLALSISGPEGPVVVSFGPERWSYTVQVANSGPAHASQLDVHVATTLPHGVSVAAALPAAGTFADATWSIPSLEAGAAPLELRLDFEASPTTVDGSRVEIVASLGSADQAFVGPIDDIAVDGTTILTSPVLTIPTTSDVGLILLALLLGWIAIWNLPRR